MDSVTERLAPDVRVVVNDINVAPDAAHALRVQAAQVHDPSRERGLRERGVLVLAKDGEVAPSVGSAPDIAAEPLGSAERGAARTRACRARRTQKCCSACQPQNPRRTA